MTIRELYEEAREAASALYDGREAASIALLMADAAGVSRLDLLADPLREVARPAGWDGMLEELIAGRPVQYILGHTEFCGLRFSVREGVLIPRPETEELVAWIVESDAAAHDILDVGTGSGAIAVALGKMLPGAAVTGIDISPVALEIARGNAEYNGVHAGFFRADALSQPEGWDGGWVAGGYDVVVSNPPYVPASDLPAMHVNVRGYEPHGALFVPDDDALVFYRAVAQHTRQLLRAGGALYFEIYERFADGVAELLAGMEFGGIEVRRDMNGKDRMVRCVKR